MVTPCTSRLQSSKMAVTAMDDLGQWTDLFVAVAGAFAALAGLVTVAISANIREILRFNWLPSRAAATIGVLVLILVVSIAGLIKPQSIAWLGIKTIAFAAVAWVLTARVIFLRMQIRREHKRPWYETEIHRARRCAPSVRVPLWGQAISGTRKWAIANSNSRSSSTSAPACWVPAALRLSNWSRLRCIASTLS